MIYQIELQLATMKNKWPFLLLIFVMSCQAQTVVPEPLAEFVEETAVEEVVAEPASAPVEPKVPTAVPTVVEVVEESIAEETPTPELATAVPEPTDEPVEEVVDYLQTGRTDLGAYYMGSPNAPIRMIDYSDFL